MNINDMKSNLKMSNLYFSKCLVEHGSSISSGEYSADLQKSITKKAEHTYEVELKLSLEKEDLKLLVVANACFIYEAETYEREEVVVNTNTIAIMFPFIRSQVSLLTTQPGMTPIVLPPINTSKFK